MYRIVVYITSDVFSIAAYFYILGVIVDGQVELNYLAKSIFYVMFSL